MQSHIFHPSILRAYDIRGRYNETLREADTLALGHAFGSWLKTLGGHNVVVGFDGRISSPALEAALCEGLAACGLEVMRIGLGPTPMLYFATTHLNAAAGLMITGSHNPAPDNGCKMLLGPALGHKAGPVYGEAIQALGARAAAGDFNIDDKTVSEGNISDVDVMPAYIERLLQDFPFAAAEAAMLNVVWDCGNGAGGAVLPKLVEKLPGKHRLLFAEVDGHFPNHHPDPTVESNLVDLRAAVLAEQADCGIGFDGDADRIGALDNLGRVVAGDQLLSLYAEPVIAANPGATIIADVKASRGFFDHVAKLGGRPVMWKTGHSLIKTKMKELHAPLAGEMSGHIFFADRWYGFDDALYAALRLIAILVQGGENLAACRDRLPQSCSTPEIRIPCADTRKFAVLDEVKARLLAIGAVLNDVDGVRVDSGSGWWLLRASNTQPVIVARAEADNEADLAQLLRQIEAELALSSVAFTPDAH